MTNTKFRKRALLSSVAMLLVALVALGSATFAWYQANMSVSAAGMTFTTNAASGLQIISASQVTANAVEVNNSALEGAVYGTAATFTNRGTALQPASYDQGTLAAGKYFTATGTSASDGTLKVGATISDSSNFVGEYVYFKIDDAGTTTGGKVVIDSVTINPIAEVEASDPNYAVVNMARQMSSAVRVVVYKFNGDFAAEYAITGGTMAKLTTAGTYTAPTDENDTITIGSVDYDSDFVGTKTVTSASAATAIELGAVTKSKVSNQGALIRVYLDGFDANVISNNATVVAASQMVLGSINLGFTMTEPTTA